MPNEFTTIDIAKKEVAVKIVEGMRNKFPELNSIKKQNKGANNARKN